VPIVADLDLVLRWFLPDVRGRFPARRCYSAAVSDGAGRTADR
jgi:hypothetical protein